MTAQEIADLINKLASDDDDEEEDEQPSRPRRPHRRQRDRVNVSVKYKGVDYED